MKLNTPFLLMLFAIVSCNQPTGTETADYEKNKGYVSEYDTFYKPNSTEIESITRVFFYKKTDAFSGDYIKIQQDKGDSNFSLLMHQEEKGESKLSVAIFDEKELNKFFDDLNTIVKNSDKNLNYDYYNLSVHSVSGDVYFRGSDTNGGYVSMNLNKEDFNNMKEAYSKYQKEKTITK